ncbi:MAG: glycosyltransferase family 2 protein [Planctomycetota bacterium]
MPDPRVTVVMPMRNARPWVAEALRSILDEPGCPPEALEVVVIDDGSTDGSADAVAELSDARIRVVPGPRRGISAAFNAGLAEARGGVLMRCDADDVYEPGRVGRQLASLEEDAELAAVCGPFVMIDRQGRALSEVKPDLGTDPVDLTDELLHGKTRTHLCTYAMRTELVRELGGCRPFFEIAEDLDLQCRLASRGGVRFEPGSAYRYRLLDASITHQTASGRRVWFTDCAKRFALQRLESGQDDLDRGEPPEPPESPADVVHGETPAGAAPRQSAAAHAAHLLCGRAWAEHRSGKRLAGLCTMTRACLARPSHLGMWRGLVVMGLRSLAPGAGRAESS